LELLLIPVLLISGAVLVYLGAGGTYPFAQPDSRINSAPPRATPNRPGRPNILASQPEPVAYKPDAFRTSEAAYLADEAAEAELRYRTGASYRPGFSVTDGAYEPSDRDVAQEPYEPEAPYEPLPRYVPETPFVAERPDISQRPTTARAAYVSETPYVSAETGPASASGVETPSPSDLLLTELLGELLEMRKELAAVRSAVDTLSAAQSRRPTADEARTTRANVFASRHGAPVET
jgi:hypothetical protein